MVKGSWKSDFNKSLSETMYFSRKNLLDFHFFEFFYAFYQTSFENIFYDRVQRYKFMS